MIFGQLLSLRYFNSALIDSLTEELAKLERKLNTLIEMRTEGEISKELFKSKASEIEAREGEIRAKLASLKPAEDVPTESDYANKLELLIQLLESYRDYTIPENIPEQIVEAFIKKIVVFPDYTEWYLRITDDGEAPIKAELSGTMKSGLKVTFNGVDNAQLSLAQHRQLLSNS